MGKMSLYVSYPKELNRFRLHLILSNHISIRFDVLAAVAMKIVVFRNVRQCNLVDRYQPLRGTLKHIYQTTQLHIPEDNNLELHYCWLVLACYRSNSSLT
jgi:hypothetical protein